MPKRVLILGGTPEATALAERLAKRNEIEPVLSLAGRTKNPRVPDVALRQGGFGGAEGLAAYLRSESIDALVDATHPFAAIMAGNAAVAEKEADCPRLKLLRPAWEKTSEDSWLKANDSTDAARLIPEGARVLLTVGHKEVAPFSTRADAWYLVRLIEAPPKPLPLPNHDVLLARGPFGLAEERRLIADKRIDCLVTKNSGGAGMESKLLAARDAAISVIMIERPIPPAGPLVSSVEDAIDWLETVLTRNS